MSNILSFLFIFKKPWHFFIQLDPDFVFLDTTYAICWNFTDQGRVILKLFQRCLSPYFYIPKTNNQKAPDYIKSGLFDSQSIYFVIIHKDLTHEDTHEKDYMDIGSYHICKS